MSPPGAVTDNPAVITNNYGKGRVVYIAGNIEDNYSCYAFPVYRKLLNNAVLYAASERPRIVVEAPLNVEATFFEQKNPSRTIVHFVNCPEQRRGESSYDVVTQVSSGVITRKAVFEQTNPIYGIKIAVRGNIANAYLAPSMEKLDVTTGGGISEITVPKVGLWETVVMDEVSK